MVTAMVTAVHRPIFLERRVFRVLAGVAIGLVGSSARACGKHSTWKSMTYGSPLARGPAATLELVSTRTSVLVST